MHLTGDWRSLCSAKALVLTKNGGQIHALWARNTKESVPVWRLAAFCLQALESCNTWRQCTKLVCFCLDDWISLAGNVRQAQFRRAV